MLHRVEVGEAFSNILLHRLAERAGLSDHERALAAELTLGVLRHRARLDRALARFLRYPLDDLTPRIRATLRVGAYQLIFLPRIPHPVAVHETVELARRVGHPGVVKLVNAVLRRLAAEGEPPLPDPAADPIAALAIRHSHPQWLVARWVARWGAEEAKALCAADNETPPSCLRVNMLLTSRDAVLEMLRTAGAAAEASPAFDEAIRVRGGATQVRARLADEGKVTVQDEGALAVVRALDPRPGETVIDACAAPGGKTTHIAERMGNRGRVIAADVHPGKLQVLSRRCAQMKIDVVEAHHLDARGIGARFGGEADRVLVDAPCTGLGVLRRRPEIRWRVAVERFPEMAALQRDLLAGAAGAVRPGGVLVYSVCSLEPEEGEEVVAVFLRQAPEFVLDPIPPLGNLPLRDDEGRAASRGMVTLFPHRHETDGFFIARMRRRDARG